MSDVVVVDEVPAELLPAVQELIEAAAATDGQPAVSEQGRLQLRGGRRAGVRHILLRADDDQLLGYAQLEDTDPVESPAGELVVQPAHRGKGHGRRLGQALLDSSGKRLRVWAHGGHPAARHLAQSLGLALFRELRQMRRPLAGAGGASGQQVLTSPGFVAELPEPAYPQGVSVRTFRPGEDDAAWLELNAAAFAHHPEQGSLTQRDLDDRKGESWFDPAGFFLAVREEDGAFLGFHWTKVHSAEQLGEIYVLGVAPEAQGLGLGKNLTVTGLRHLERDRGLPTAMLYVDADNTAAVTVYERMGFRTHETDLMYRTES
jgi:mycothiol synthase